jgi:Protein of unknown function (DUF2877)
VLMTHSNGNRHEAVTFDRTLADRLDVVVPILRSGVLAREFCRDATFAKVEAVFERCIYLRSGDDFVCIGEPGIGNGPITLIGHLGGLPTLKRLGGQTSFVCREWITIGNSIRLILHHSELWRPLGWPICPSPDRLIDISAVLGSLTAIAAPQEGLARCVAGQRETSGRSLPLARVARPRITIFERWVSGMLDAGHISGADSREAVQGLIGLGPGLTPSGDDFLIGALSALDAIGERESHAATARAIVEVLPGLTTPLSACLLRAAAAGHVGENLHRIVSLIMIGRVDAAIAAAGKIGHSSGWDMMAGILTILRIAAVLAKAISGSRIPSS